MEPISNQIVSTTYNPVLSGAIRGAASRNGPADSQTCTDPNYFDSVIVPFAKEHLPEEGSVRGLILDHVTGVYRYLNTVGGELCDNGRMSMDSARATLGMFARSATSAATLGAAVYLGAAGVAISGPVAIPVVAGAAALGLAVLPPLADRVIKAGLDAAQGFLDKTKDWIRSLRG